VTRLRELSRAAKRFPLKLLESKAANVSFAAQRRPDKSPARALRPSRGRFVQPIAPPGGSEGAEGVASSARRHRFALFRSVSPSRSGKRDHRYVDREFQRVDSVSRARARARFSSGARASCRGSLVLDALKRDSATRRGNKKEREESARRTTPAKFSLDEGEVGWRGWSSWRSGLGVGSVIASS